MVTSAGQLALFALGTYAASGAPGATCPPGHPAFPSFPPFLCLGVFCARVGEEREANAFRGLQDRRQGESLVPTRDLGSLFQRGGRSSAQPFPGKWPAGGA